MEDDLFRTGDPQRLAHFVRMLTGRAPIWQPDERHGLLQHQLSTPIAAELEGLESVDRRQVDDLIAGTGGSVRTFRGLFDQAEPPLELLRLARAYFRSPAEVARALAITGVAAAFTRCGARLVDLDDPGLRREFQWVLSQPWGEDPPRSLCRQARDRLGT